RQTAGKQSIVELFRSSGSAITLHLSPLLSPRPCGDIPHDSDTEDSVLQLRWYFAAVLGKFPHHLLTQPDVHRRGIAHITCVAQLSRELAAVLQAGVEADELHQIHDRSTPVELLTLGSGHRSEEHTSELQSRENLVCR